MSIPELTPQHVAALARCVIVVAGSPQLGADEHRLAVEAILRLKHASRDGTPVQWSETADQ